MKKLKVLIVALVLITIFLFGQNGVNAQFRTDSNTVTTRIGVPNVSDSTLAAVAEELGTVVGGACGGFVRRSNLDCLQGLTFQNIPNPAAAIAQLAQSANNNDCPSGYCLQCVGFVQGAVAGAFGQPLNNGGDAKDYAIRVPSGYQYISASSGTPVEGDIIISTNGQSGHIAVITKVYGEGRIQIAEANWNYGGEIGPPRNKMLSSFSGWLRKQ